MNAVRSPCAARGHHRLSSANLWTCATLQPGGPLSVLLVLMWLRNNRWDDAGVNGLALRRYWVARATTRGSKLLKKEKKQLGSKQTADKFRSKFISRETKSSSACLHKFVPSGAVMKWSPYFSPAQHWKMKSKMRTKDKKGRKAYLVASSARRAAL